MNTRARTSGSNVSADPDRVGTVRRFGYSIAISLVYEQDDGRVLRLAALPGSGGAVLGEIVCRGGQASPLWDEAAADIGVVDGSMFAAGLVRTVLAIDAARDGTPIDCVEHGLRLDPRCRFFLPTTAEADA